MTILLTIVLAVVIGLVVGSFLNVLIYRLPIIIEQQMPVDWHIAWPGSHCPHCQNTLKWWHNVPVISFLLLRGRCYFCSAPISWHYPVVELITALATVLVALIAGCNYSWLIISMLLIWPLIALWMIDWYHQLLPDELTLGLLWLGLLVSVLAGPIEPSTAIISAVVGFVSFWVIDQAYYLVRGQHGLGGGDMKLLAALGAWLGWHQLPLLVLIASCLTLLSYGLSQGLRQWRWQARLAFGPYLIIAGVVLWISSFLYPIY